MAGQEVADERFFNVCNRLRALLSDEAVMGMIIRALVSPMPGAYIMHVGYEPLVQWVEGAKPTSQDLEWFFAHLRYMPLGGTLECFPELHKLAQEEGLTTPLMPCGVTRILICVLADDGAIKRTRVSTILLVSQFCDADGDVEPTPYEQGSTLGNKE